MKARGGFNIQQPTRNVQPNKAPLLRRCYGLARPLIGLALVCGALLLPGQVFAEARFPAPEFESAYQIPSPTTPHPDHVSEPYVALGYIAVALAVATYLLLKRRSRRGVAIVSVVSLIYLGFWRDGCICVIGSLQNVTMALFDPGYTIPLVIVLTFMLPLVVTLFFGRTFCGAVCPLGMIQDVVALRPAKVPGWVDQSLGMVPHLYLGLTVLFAATGTGFIICQYDPFVSIFRLGGSFGMLLLGGAFLVGGIFVARPYCRYLCPYSVLLRWTSRFSRTHLRITPASCVQCRLCENSCPYGAIRKPVPAALPEPARQGRRRLGVLLVLLPVLVLLGAVAGYAMHVPLSTAHPTVNLAEQMLLETRNPTVEQTVESEAFRGAGRPVADLYVEALGIRRQFRIGTILLGCWMGLVIGGKLIALAVHRVREDYEPDRATCLSCGRCYASCPVKAEAT